MSFTDEQINKIRALLDAAGDDWPQVAETLPEVRAYDHAHGSARAVIELTGPRGLNVHYQCEEPYAILYRVEAGSCGDDDGTERTYPAAWYPVGWSDVGRSRPGRRITPAGIEMYQPVIVNPTRLDRMREKIVGARAMFEAAAANPDLDRGFVQDLYDYLHEGEGR